MQGFQIPQPDFQCTMIYNCPHCLTRGLSLLPVIYFREADFPFEWCESVCLTWWEFMSCDSQLLPQGPWKWYIVEGEEGSAVFADRTEWTRLPGDRTYLCICQHFSIKIGRVTEVWGGVWKEQQTKTQPSISCLPGVGSGQRTSVTHLCKQPLHKDADGIFSQAPAFFPQGLLPKKNLHGRMA